MATRRPRYEGAAPLLHQTAHGHWNTLGVAHYHAVNWKAATVALKKSDELLKGNELSFNAFFLAMAHWQLGNKDEARKWYDQAVGWMEKNKPHDEELRRFRAEAEALLKIEKKPMPKSRAWLRHEMQALSERQL